MKFRLLRDVDVMGSICKAGEIRTISEMDIVSDTRIKRHIGHGCHFSLDIGTDIELIKDDSPWIDVKERMPTENVWVLGMCKLQGEILSGYDPVMFQVKYQAHCGWSDWCGDGEGDDEWRVLKWMPIPKVGE